MGGFRVESLTHSLATFVAVRTDDLPGGKPQTLQRVTHNARSWNGWMDGRTDGWDDRGKISLMIPFGKENERRRAAPATARWRLRRKRRRDLLGSEVNSSSLRWLW